MKSLCKMALQRTQLNDEKILSMIVTLQNLWSCALVIHHRALNSMITYKLQRKRLINLLLTNSPKKLPSKKIIFKPRDHWVRPGRTNSWWLSFEQNKVVPS